MKGKTVHVGIFDQIVSGGGVRLFTVKLLEEFSRLAGNNWHFHLMWPLFDSSNHFLPAPQLPHTSFERIGIDANARTRNRIFTTLEKNARARKTSHLNNLPASKFFTDYEQHARFLEQRSLRALDGRGLRWLDERTNEFDLIFMPYPYLTLPQLEEWQPRKPVVITLHDLAHEHTDAWSELTEPLRREVKKWTHLADLVVFSSDFISNEARGIYGLPVSRAKRIYLVPNETGAGEQSESDQRMSEASAEVRRRYGIAKRKYVFTLGWAARHKRVETIVEGFALFKQKSNADVALVIAGPNTETLLRGDTHGLEIGRDLFALGYVDDEDIPVLHQNSSLVVSASISEAGLNAVIMDAMYHGKAVACSNIPQFTERLGTDDALALMFDPYSPQSLAEVFLKHFNDPAQSARRAQNAQQFIHSRNLSHVGREYLEAFASVL